MREREPEDRPKKERGRGYERKSHMRERAIRQRAIRQREEERERAERDKGAHNPKGDTTTGEKKDDSHAEHTITERSSANETADLRAIMNDQQAKGWKRGDGRRAKQKETEFSRRERTEVHRWAT